jgi:hypothetical protein
MGCILDVVYRLVLLSDQDAHLKSHVSEGIGEQEKGAYVIEQLSELLERALNLLDVFLTILDFLVCCSGLTIPGRARKLSRPLFGKCRWSERAP